MHRKLLQLFQKKIAWIQWNECRIQVIQHKTKKYNQDQKRGRTPVLLLMGKMAIFHRRSVGSRHRQVGEVELRSI
jgi:hypothetical protein